MDVFNKELWENKIIWSPQFIESIEDAYKKRNNKCITLPSLRLLLTSLGILKPSKCNLKVGVNTQSRVEYTKEENIKVNKIKIEDVKSYFFENNYSEYSAQKFYDYYSIANWKDSKGNQVKNWKQKAQAVWFKPENEIIDNNSPSKMVY